MLQQLVPLIHQAPEQKDTTIKEGVSLDLARVAATEVDQLVNIGDLGINLGYLINDLVLHRWLLDVLSEQIVHRGDRAPLKIRTDLVIVGHKLNCSDCLAIGCMGTRTNSLIPDIGIPVAAGT